MQVTRSQDAGLSTINFTAFLTVQQHNTTLLLATSGLAGIVLWVCCSGQYSSDNMMHLLNS
jgi:hypothetical protein